jgi:hypothetical protein
MRKENQSDDVEQQKRRLDPITSKKNSLVAVVNQIAICA